MSSSQAAMADHCDILFAENISYKPFAHHYWKILAARHAGKVNVLLVDTDEFLCRSIAENASGFSPAFNVHYATTYDQARIKAVSIGKNVWHCWVLGVSSESWEALDLLKLRQAPQLSIALANAACLDDAHHIFEKGVSAAFVKTPDIIRYDSRFRAELSRQSALAYVLRGARSDYKRFFNPLLRETVKTPSAWAYSAGISTRYLREICMLHASLNPTMLIPYYYAMERLLRGYPSPDNEVFEDGCAQFVAARMREYGGSAQNADELEKIWCRREKLAA